MPEKVLHEQKLPRTPWWHFSDPPRCPRCRAALVVYCTRNAIQYRHCPNRCGNTRTTARK